MNSAAIWTFTASLALLLSMETGAWAGSLQPKATGLPHSCSEYPKEAIAAGAQGTTQLSFQIATEGKVKHIKVADSSGNDDLDASAVQCAYHWRYEPAKKDGTPVEVMWMANVVWQLPQSTSSEVAPTNQALTLNASQSAISAAGPTTPPRPAGSPHVCNPDVFVDARPSAWNGPATVSFLIESDGTVKDVTIAQTSGSPDIDRLSAECAANWRYIPAQLNGQPIETRWTVQVYFHNDGERSTTITAMSSHPCNLPADTKSSEVTRDTILSFWISPKGYADDVFMAESSGNSDLDVAAVSCASHWYFSPSEISDHASDTPITIKIDWKSK